VHPRDAEPPGDLFLGHAAVEPHDQDAQLALGHLQVPG
jgi:hypothetical protein